MHVIRDQDLILPPYKYCFDINIFSTFATKMGKELEVTHKLGTD